MGARWDASDKRGRFYAILLVALATWNVGTVIHEGDELPPWMNMFFVFMTVFCLFTAPIELKWGKRRREKKDAGDSDRSV